MRPTLQNLQALRGLACLVVIGYHLAAFENVIWTKFHLMRPMQWFGYAGVDLFFVLSGFIITWSHVEQLGQPRHLPRYLFRRAWRIYPVLWASCLLAAVLIGSLGMAEVFVPGWLGDWVEWLLLIPRFEPFRFIAATWSLNYEMLFYAAFGLLFLLPRRVAGWLGIAWAIVIVLAQAVEFAPRSFWANMLISPFVLEFLGGTLVAGLVRRGCTRGVFGCCVVAGLWLLLFIPLLRGPTPDDLGGRYAARVVTFGLPCVLLVYAMVAGEKTQQIRLPRWLGRIGDASYSIYLVHGPVCVVVMYLTWSMSHNLLPHFLWLAMLAGSGIGAGWLMYVLVERPLMNRTRRNSGPPPASPTIFEASTPRHLHNVMHFADNSKP